MTRDPPADWVEPEPNIDPVSGEVIPPPSAPPMSFGAGKCLTYGRFFFKE